MTEFVIGKLYFEGKASSGVFSPPAKSFPTSEPVILSALRVTVISALDGRRHALSASISGPSSASIYSDVPDNTPTIVGPGSSLRSCPPGTYDLDIRLSGFSPEGNGEDVSVEIDVLRLDTNAAKITRDVLRVAEAELDINAIAFGISEASFATFMSHGSITPEFQVGTTSSLKLELELKRNNYPYWPLVHLDVEAQEFVLSTPMQITLSRRNPPFSPPIALISADLNVFFKPAMVTTTEDTLQIQFRRAELVNGTLSVDVRDPSSILDGFPDLSAFDTAVKDYLAQITSGSGPLGYALPNYLASRPMPDHWRSLLNMRIRFERFDYRTVTVHGLPVAYLFIVFSIQGLGLSAPCFCESELSSVTEANAEPDQIGHPPTDFEISLILPQYAEYVRFPAAAQIGAFGLSQKSLQEIARSYANQGVQDRLSGGGSVRWTVGYWFTSRLERVEIVDDGVKATIDVTAEGNASAALKQWGVEIASARLRLRIQMDDNSCKWDIRMLQEIQGRKPTLLVDVIPTADVAKPNVSFEGVFDPPRPFDRVDDAILTAVAGGCQSELNKLVEKHARFRLLSTTQYNGTIRMFFVDRHFFAGAATVVLGQLSITWG